MDKVIVVNIEKCLGCKSCELACALVHSKSKVTDGYSRGSGGICSANPVPAL